VSVVFCKVPILAVVEVLNKGVDILWGLVELFALHGCVAIHTAFSAAVLTVSAVSDIASPSTSIMATAATAGDTEGI